MKRKLLCTLLCIEAILCIAFNAARLSTSDAFSAAMAFPFEQIGALLRRLSLTGVIGNCIALAIYAVLCISPVLFLLGIGSKRKLRAEDSLLVILSAALFGAIYLMINPAYIANVFADIDGTGFEISKAVLGGTIWSITVGYVILRVLRLSFESGAAKLHGYAGALLNTLCFLFVWVVCGNLFGELLNSFSALLSGNRGSESGLGATYVFLVLRFFVDALPYVLNIITVFLALDPSRPCTPTDIRNRPRASPFAFRIGAARLWRQWLYPACPLTCFSFYSPVRCETLTTCYPFRSSPCCLYWRY